MKGLVAIAFAAVLAACGESAPSLPLARALSAEGSRHAGISWSPDGKRIAWWQPSEDSTIGVQLWVANADFSSPMKLPVIGTKGSAASIPVTWSPDGTQIAAGSSEWGRSDVVVLPAAGGPARRITHGGAIHLPGGWNKDGDRIAINETAEGGTFRTSVFSLSTGKLISLVPHEKHPFIGTWSPDGAHIAYVEVDGPRKTMWVADSAGEHPRALTTEGFEGYPWLFNASPWSPDGKEILYESRRTGTSDLWIAPIDGSKVRQLTRDIRNDYNGSWSSDGKWIAFTSDRGHQVDVWAISSAGGAEHRVTDTPTEENEPPRFRPRTLELSYVDNSSKSGVWAVDAIDGKERRLTPDSVRTSFFNIAPDGKQIDFVIERGGGIQDLAVMAVSGGPFRTLVSGGGTVAGAYWSPSGTKIAFQSDRAGVGDIFIIDATGGAPRQLEKWPGYESVPTWGVDDSWIYFLSDRDAKIHDVWKVAPTGGEPVRVTRDGAVNNLFGRRGVPALFVSTFGRREGAFPTSRVDPDGTLHPIWDKTNSFAEAVSPKGDSVLLAVDQPNGKTQAMVFPTRGGNGRILLPPTEAPGYWSQDGKSMIYYFRSAGNRHVGILTLSSGAKRPLTHSTASDIGAEWTPDGKTIVLNRYHDESRIFTADLTALLKSPKP